MTCAANRYSQEWRKTVRRAGRWIDFDNDYKTLNLEFMETVWWVFGQIFKKGLVYKGMKVRSLHPPRTDFVLLDRNPSFPKAVLKDMQCLIYR